MQNDPQPPEPDHDTADGPDGSAGSARPGGRRASTLMLVAAPFFVLIGALLWGVWVFGDAILTVGRGTSILMLGVGFIIALNLIAIVLMLVLLRTIKGRDD